MALEVIRPADVQQRVNDLIQRWQNDEEQRRLLEETRQCVRHYERLFGLPSNQIHRAIDSGELEETLEVSRWIFDYNILQRVDQT